MREHPPKHTDTIVNATSYSTPGACSSSKISKWGFLGSRSAFDAHWPAVYLPLLYLHLHGLGHQLSAYHHHGLRYHIRQPADDGLFRQAVSTRAVANTGDG